MTSRAAVSDLLPDWARAAAEQIDDLLCLCRDGILAYINPAGARLLGSDDPAALLGSPLAGLVHLHSTRLIDHDCALLRDDGEASSALLFLRQDGSIAATQACAWLVPGRQDEPAAAGGVLIHARIVGVPRRDELMVDLRPGGGGLPAALPLPPAVEERLRLAAAVFDVSAEAIMVLDAAFRITEVNPAFTAITGYAAAEVLGRQPDFLFGEDGDDGFARLCERLRRDGRWQGEHWSRRKNGEEYAERLSVSAIADRQGRVVHHLGVFADITQRKLDQERIRYQASYDALTGLPNRQLFLDRLAQMLELAQSRGQRLGLMFIDLDGFKLVNDTLGHDVGDELLKETARRLMLCVRHGDTVARLGGDEFTVVMSDVGELGEASAIALRIIGAIERPFLLGQQEAFVSASIGITLFPDDAVTSQALLSNADAAMYRAKEQGKARFQFFTAEMNAEVSARLVIKNGLSKALERQEFALHYQPKCDVATGRMTGVEALLRWHGRDIGPVPPDRFIPVMEDTGLITQVGEWVLDCACAQHRAWRDAGHPLRVAVNLSVRQLRQPDLPGMIQRLLDRHGIPPAGLELEITESMIIKDSENAVGVLRSLADMGIHLAMDDFGTGYSSLRYLKRFPLDTIKIDRSFINDIATDPDDLEIIRTIISMGHSLRRKIVAEGVETEAQRSLLRKLRCDEMQGFLLSPAVPADEIDRMLASMRFGESV